MEHLETLPDIKKLAINQTKNSRVHLHEKNPSTEQIAMSNLKYTSNDGWEMPEGVTLNSEATRVPCPAV